MERYCIVRRGNVLENSISVPLAEGTESGRTEYSRIDALRFDLLYSTWGCLGWIVRCES